MIEAKEILTGNINTKSSLEGNINVGIQHVYPILEDITIAPSLEEQTFKSSKYGYNEIKVEAIPVETIEVMPSTEEKKVEGLFKEVTVAGDENLVSENIKKDVEIFGVTGSMAGERELILESKVVNPSTSEQVVTYEDGYDGLSKVIVKAVTSKIDNNIVASNIKKDINILGVTGSLEAEKANLQTKTITPTTEQQTINPDTGFDGFSSINVNAVTKAIDSNIKSENIKSGVSILGVEGSIVAGEEVTVKYAPSYISFRGYEGTDLSEDTRNLDTSNMTTMASMFHAISDLTTIDLSGWDFSNVTSLYYFCYNCKKLNTLGTNLLKNTGNVTTMYQAFYSCTYLTSIPEMDTSKVTTMQKMCMNSNRIKTIPELDLSSCTNVNSAFTGCTAVTTLGGFLDLGKAYPTSISENASQYCLSLISMTKLTHESLMNVINKLYDIKSKGCNPQELEIGSTNIGKLTEEEIAIATNKGWNVT